MSAGDEIIIPGTKVVDKETIDKEVVLNRAVLRDATEKAPALSHTPETYKLIETARQELKDWNVKWGYKPERDSRAIEAALKLREENNSDPRVKPYLADERYVDEKGRVHNLMHFKDFCWKLHNILGPTLAGGTRIMINEPPKHPSMDSRMKGMFIRMRGMEQFIYHTDCDPGVKKICSIQVPYMSEWGIMNLDDRGCFKSWKYVGWRGNVLLRLILADAITEEEAHKEFGPPQGNDTDREYFKRLEAHRRAKREVN